MFVKRQVFGALRRGGAQRRMLSNPPALSSQSGSSSSGSESGSTLKQRVKSFVLGAVLGVAINAGMLYDEIRYVHRRVSMEPCSTRT